MIEVTQRDVRAKIIASHLRKAGDKIESAKMIDAVVDALKEIEEKEKNRTVLSTNDYLELMGALIDTVEDWLEDKGITADDIPNDEREEEEDNAAIIYGSDYDFLSNSFAAILGIEEVMPN